MNTGRDSASLRFPEASADGRKRAAKPAGPTKRACGLFPFRVLIRPPLYPLRPIRLRLLAPGPLPRKPAPPVSSVGCPAARIPLSGPFFRSFPSWAQTDKIAPKKRFSRRSTGNLFFFLKKHVSRIFSRKTASFPRGRLKRFSRKHPPFSEEKGE